MSDRSTDHRKDHGVYLRRIWPYPRATISNTRRARFSKALSVAFALALVAGLVQSVNPSSTPSSLGAPLAKARPLTYAQLADSSQGVAPSYQPGDEYGGGSPAENCTVCSLASIVKSSGGQSLDPKANVNPETGDFSQSNTLFSIPSPATPLNLTLTYSSLLAQGEIAGGQTSPGQFGWGWKANTSSSLSAIANGIAVNEANGSQIQYTRPTADGCPSGDYQDFQKYTIAGTSLPYCAANRVDAQLGFYAPYAAYEFSQSGGKSTDVYNYLGMLVGEGTQGNLFAINYTYNLTPGSSGTSCPTGTWGTQTVASCTKITSGVSNATSTAYLIMNSSGEVIGVIDPVGRDIMFSYSSAGDLTSIENLGQDATYNYGYSSAASPYNNDMTSVQNPNGYTMDVNYTSTGMVSAESDQVDSTTGSKQPLNWTNYSYYNPNCSPAITTAANCVSTGQVQKTTVVYPDGETDVDNYFGGVLASFSYGSVDPSSPNYETWTLNYTYPSAANQDGPTTETVVYPGANHSTATATIVTDSVGNIDSITDANGNKTTDMFNDTGGNNLDELCWTAQPSVTIPANASCQNPPSGSTHYTYDSTGRELSVTDPLGNTTRYGYYANLSPAEPGIGLLCWSAPPTVNGGGGPCTSPPTAGNGEAPAGATTYAYDDLGDLTTTTTDAFNPDQSIVTDNYTNDGVADGILASSTDAIGTTTYGYSNEHLVSKTTPGGFTTRYTYDADGNVLTATDPAGDVTTNAYDADGRLCWSFSGPSAVDQGTPTCADAAPSGSTQYRYVADTSAVDFTSNPDGFTTTATYRNPAYPSEPTTVTDEAGNTTFQVYDSLGNSCLSGPGDPYSVTPTPSCSWASGDTANVFNAQDVLQSSENPDGQTITYSFGNTAFPSQPTKTVNPYGTTNVNYNSDGNAAFSWHIPAGSSTADAAESFGYNADGKLCYQALGIVGAACPSGNAAGPGAPAGPGDITASYDGQGRATMVVNNYGTATATTSTSTYNSVGQLTGASDDNGKSLSYGYNAVGQQDCLGYTVPGSTAAASCSAPASPSNPTVTYGYDPAGRIQTVSDWAGNSINYGYTNDGRSNLSTVSFSSTSSSGNETVNYGYDASSNLTSMSYGGNLAAAGIPAQTWTPNTQGLTGSSSILSPSTNSLISSTNTFNNLDRVQQATNPTPTATTSPSGTGSGSQTDTYHYDPAGNITSDSASTGTNTGYSYYSGSKALSAATTTIGSTATTTSYGYTGEGQRCWTSSVAVSTTSGCSGTAPTGATGSTDAWNLSGQMCWTSPQVVSQAGQSSPGFLTDTPNPCANLPTGAATAYSYNASGERMTSTPEMNGAPSASPTDFTWNNAASLPEINQVSTATGVGNAYVYGPLLFGGSAPEEQISTASSGSTAPTVTFMASTPQGVQLTFTTSGTVLNKASYTAYGQQINSNPTPAVTVPFGFDGGYTDSTGLDYFINRYYDPTTAQFISVDPQLAATGEAYAFAGDNPLNATDPTGLSWWGAIVHAVRRVAHAVNHFVHVVGHFVRTHWKAIVTVAAIVAAVVVITVATAGVGDLALGAAAAAGEGAVEAAGEGAVELASEEAAAAEEEAAAEAAQQAAERKAAQEAARETTSEVQSANSSDASSTSQSTDEGQSCVLQSFTPTTLVKMANGTTEAIKDIKIGDKVLATNPKTGVTIAEAVTATNIHNDSDLMDVVVATTHGDQTIHATDRHPFWDKTSNSWTFAENLHPSDSLRTLGGGTATVVRTVQLPGNAFMWDLTVSTDHDFYVSVGAGSQTAVLVHNIDERCGVGPFGGDSIPADGESRAFSAEQRQAINDIGNDTGCHTCGSTDPGTQSGNFVPDHQPPIGLNPNGEPMDLYPQCLGCSRIQGGMISGILRGM